MIEVGKVEMVALNSIKVGERTREVMGDLNEMEASMKERGLISPLAVKEDGNNYLLLAGERRFLVLQRNSVASVPVRIYPSNISELEVKSIELAENLFRKDFEYWEYDNLVREVHSLQQEIYGVKAPGPSQTGWSTENTGDMLGITKASVSTAISRANAREAFPDLFDKCKTQKDATKLMENMVETAVKDAMSKRLESNRENTSLTQLAKRYILKDFFKGVKDIPDEVINLVEIDPPYAIDLKNLKKSESEAVKSTSDYNEIDQQNYQAFLANTFKECYRVMAQHSWLLCWFAPEPWFEIVFRELQIAGFNSTRMCGIWTKGYGQSKRPEIHLANSYEIFFYAWKGRPALNKAGRSNEFNFAPVPGQNKVHPTERPIELMKEIYDTFAFQGSQILIPFLGSGSGILAAYDLGMTATGFELSESYRNSFLLKLHDRGM